MIISLIHYIFFCFSIMYDNIFDTLNLLLLYNVKLQHSEESTFLAHAGLFWGVHNPPNSELDKRIFNILICTIPSSSLTWSNDSNISSWMFQVLSEKRAITLMWLIFMCKTGGNVLSPTRNVQVIQSILCTAFLIGVATLQHLNYTGQ